MPKIAFIGAGSIVFAQNLLVDILSFPEHGGSTIALMDIDERRLANITDLAKKIVAQEGYEAKIQATTDRRVALRGADYVIFMFQVGGLDAYARDVEIPLRYGINQAVGDTLGPGGVFRALRTIPVIFDICRDMTELCPDALLMNYVNPMAINCWALYKAFPDLKSIGLCHSVQETSADIARYIDAPCDEISFKCAGINHMAWFLEYKWKGKDAYPILKERCHDQEIYKKDAIKFEILRYFGYFVTESSYHMSEYVPYYRKHAEWIEKVKNIDSWLKYSEGSYFKLCRDLAAHDDELFKSAINAEKVSVTRTHEYASYIINAVETGRRVVVNGNVENRGLITNLPEGCCVEVPCVFEPSGIMPTIMGDLPAQLAALNRSNINVQELAVLGVLTGEKDAIYQAVMMDPYTSSVLTLPEIYSMVTDLFAAHNGLLPQVSW
jgi:alpha-galactosidase